jgi:molybdopterin-guanine dinucleotide biosynthesis protein A
VLVCAGDLPFVTPALIRRIASADPRRAPAVVPICEGAIQPLLALYLPRAGPLLVPGAKRAELRLRDEITAISPRLLEIADPDAFFNVNAPDDLLRAAGMLDRARAGG